ncbi:sialate O-acetylesterase [Granulicella sibirica]|uniref:Sialic acid-specific 9-O-acetylesterase n=1 Tax=Granulicella sibirica TaxID=2479048 RepID=A0A4Q0SZC1_9BACT|nr:sialate O-acetylesterase [Granulicella sibirica]RXH54571.1 Sialic acid-specific 9-O-acetylesterase [Granulicella sibirica]
MRLAATLLLATLCTASPLAAEVALPHVLSDHAVLQREKPVRIWGSAAPSENVTVKFHGQTVTAQADTFGLWEAWLKPEAAGGPFTLTVSGDATATPLQRTDILVGDVWIASGQSNMEMPLKGFNGAPLKDQEKEIAAASQPKLRLLLQKKRTSATPLGDSEDTWTQCTPDTAKDFSAVAYFFGREISNKEHVPIGLIDTTWGGTPAHSWISPQGIAYANLPSVATDAGKIAQDQGSADALKARYAIEDAALKAAGKPLPTHPRLPSDHGGSWTPGTLFNAMIAPYTMYTIKGAIWYQGETDASAERAPNYNRVLTALIQDWRRQWAQGEFPFLFVQISSFGNGTEWGTLRDAQRRTLELGGTGMAVTLDVGLAANIHPPDKQTVGNRLALSALQDVYGEKLEGTSPLFVEATPEGSAMRVWFSHAEGLTTKGKPLGGFEIAGADRKYVPATGTIEKNTILLSSPSVPAPRYVRYAWTGTVNDWLYNAAGLPAGSFTSE